MGGVKGGRGGGEEGDDVEFKNRRLGLGMAGEHEIQQGGAARACQQLVAAMPQVFTSLNA